MMALGRSGAHPTCRWIRAGNRVLAQNRRVSKGGKSVHIEIGFWLNDDGSIHVTSNAEKDFHVAVNQDPARKNGHPTLYDRLAKILQDEGAPSPFDDES